MLWRLTALAVSKISKTNGSNSDPFPETGFKIVSSIKSLIDSGISYSGFSGISGSDGFSSVFLETINVVTCWGDTLP